MTIYRISDDGNNNDNNNHNDGNAIKLDAKKARCQTEIIARILELCSDSGTKKTHIMYRANLSHEMMKSYLDRLLKCKLLEKSAEEPRSIFRTTAKGKEFLYHYFLMQTLTELGNS